MNVGQLKELLDCFDDECDVQISVFLNEDNVIKNSRFVNSDIDVVYGIPNAKVNEVVSEDMTIKVRGCVWNERVIIGNSSISKRFNILNI